MFGLTAEEQRKKARMPPREAARFETETRYWRARSLMFDQAMAKVLDLVKIKSLKARSAIKSGVRDRLDQLIKEHGGQVPETLRTKKPI